MKKKLSINRLKKKAWKTFSEWVRKRGNWRGYNLCVTCGIRKPWKELNAGHFIHGNTKATFMVEENVHPQCPRCNHYLSGDILNYYDFMLNKYGKEKIDTLKRMSKKAWNPTRAELKNIIWRYSPRIP